MLTRKAKDPAWHANTTLTSNNFKWATKPKWLSALPSSTLSSMYFHNGYRGQTQEHAIAYVFIAVLEDAWAKH